MQVTVLDPINYGYFGLWRKPDRALEWTLLDLEEYWAWYANNARVPTSPHMGWAFTHRTEGQTLYSNGRTGRTLQPGDLAPQIGFRGEGNRNRDWFENKNHTFIEQIKLIVPRPEDETKLETWFSIPTDHLVFHDAKTTSYERDGGILTNTNRFTGTYYEFQLVRNELTILKKQVL